MTSQSKSISFACPKAAVAIAGHLYKYYDNGSITFGGPYYVISFIVSPSYSYFVYAPANGLTNLQTSTAISKSYSTGNCIVTTNAQGTIGTFYINAKYNILAVY